MSLRCRSNTKQTLEACLSPPSLPPLLLLLLLQLLML